LFFDIFLNQGNKGINSTKYQLKPMKDVIGTNSGAFGKTGAGTSKLESSPFLIFFEFFENALPGVARESRAFQKKNHINWSSE
jgi:hypothetical protein